MPIEGKDSSSIPKSVLNDDNSLVGAPAVGLRIRHLTVPDAVDRFPEAGCAISPIFAGMKSIKAVSKSPEVSSSGRHRSMGSVQWKNEDIYETAGRAGLPNRIRKKRFSQVA